MKKILGLVMMLGCLAITSYASDNRSAPNVFSSGSTISSSQMNENFNFLASEIREKDVNCNSGDTISEAINEGYNSLTIYGTCDGGLMVYMFDPNAFGVTYSQMLNKPISHLIITGGDSNRASKIINTSGGMNSMVTSKGYLQLYNLTFNDKININDGGMISATDITYEVTVTGEESRIGVYGNSELYISESTINAEVDVSESSLGIIKETTINYPNESALSVREGSYVEISDDSVVNGRINLSERGSIEIEEVTLNCTQPLEECISVQHSSIFMYDSDISGESLDWTVIDLAYNSSGKIRNSNINANDSTEGINIRKNSSLQLYYSDVNTVNGRALNIDIGSYVRGKDIQINRSNNEPTVAIGKFSTFELEKSSSTVSDIYCYSRNVVVEINNEVTNKPTMNDNCDGFENLIPEYSQIFTGTCESNGYQNLISAHECSQAGGRSSITENEPTYMPKGCYIKRSNNDLAFNVNNNSTTEVGINSVSAWCKQ